MNKTVLIAFSAVLLGCPSDDESGDDTVGMTGMTMSSSSAGSTGDTMMDTGDEPSTGTEESETAAECPDDSLSHAADIQPIWDQYCVPACHEPGGNWPSNDLTDAYDVIVDEDSIQTQVADNEDLVLIAPGSVENSYIIHKLRGTQADAVGDDLVAGLSMPLEENPNWDPKDPKSTEPQYNEIGPLDEAEIQLIEDWINCGAPE